MTKQTFMAILADLTIGKITTFSINYKEYDLSDEPIKTIKLEENNEKSNTL